VVWWDIKVFEWGKEKKKNNFGDGSQTPIAYYWYQP
jgi:hypothetical protein